MERKLTAFLVVVASMLLMAGCYTQIGTTRDEPSRDYSYNDQDANYETDTAAGGDYGYGSDYSRYRDRFYYDYYYPPSYSPWGYHLGVTIGGYYSPFWWNPWDPWYPVGGWYFPYASYYPGYYGGYYGGHGYYPAYSGGIGHGTTRNFGVTRRNGSFRGTASTPDLRRSAAGTGSVALPTGNSRGNYRPSTTPRPPSATSGRAGKTKTRSGEADRAGHGRTGTSRGSGRSSSPPPPPPARSGGESRGGERWTPPSSPPPASSAPASSGGSSGGSRGGGSSSGGSSGGSRGGNRR